MFVGYSYQVAMHNYAEKGWCTAIPNAAQQGYPACFSFLSYPEGIVIGKADAQKVHAL